MKNVFLLLSVSIIWSCHQGPNARIQTVNLNANWEYKYGDENWKLAQVPGTLAQELIALHQDLDPDKNPTVSILDSILQAPLEYRSTFQISEELELKKWKFLVFEGLDTYTQIRLNDSLLQRTDNAFRTWKINVSDILIKGENQLHVTFDKPDQDWSPDILPGGEWGQHRQAAFHHGWDWAPRLRDKGIIKDVKLEVWEDCHIAHFDVHTKELTSSEANLIASLELWVDQGGTYHLEIADENESLTTISTDLNPGHNQVNVSFAIKSPRLWWPRGHGPQELYHFTANLKKDGALIDRLSLQTGLRSVKLLQEKDEVGSSFMFEINGREIFAKGANWVPADIIQNEVGDEDYEHLLQLAADANMNMLRVWGGGYYESEKFYEICDRLGIMIWQDYMFACSMVPNGSRFKDNVKQEAIDNLKRLVHHPSIVLWCGNNEVSEGWARWGWKDQVSASRAVELENAYTAIFNDLLPELTAHYSPSTPYWSSSPSLGRGDPQHQFEGDAHYWGVWHDAEPFEVFDSVVPRFMSEFGFQSYPNLKTLSLDQSPIDSIEDERIQAYQMHPRGKDLMEEYMSRDYIVPSDVPHYVYVSQLVQARGMLRGVEAHRVSRPYCMGTLIWQFNDCWPSISWSMVDKTCRPKAVYYTLKNAFEDQQLFFQEQKDEVIVFVVNDRNEEWQVKGKFQLMLFDGSLKKDSSFNISLSPNSSTIIARLAKSDWSIEKSLRNSLIVAEFNDSRIQSHFFVPPKDMQLETAEIEFQIEETKDGLRVVLKSAKLHKNLYLYDLRDKGMWSNNYFDLLPGTETEILYKSDVNALELPKKIKTISLYDTM